MVDIVVLQSTSEGRVVDLNLFSEVINGVVAQLTLSGVDVGLSITQASSFELAVESAAASAAGEDLDVDLEVQFDYAVAGAVGQDVSVGRSFSPTAASLTTVGRAVALYTLILPSPASVGVVGQDVALGSQGYISADTASIGASGQSVPFAFTFPFTRRATTAAGSDVVLGPVVQAVTPDSIGADGQDIGFAFSDAVIPASASALGRQVTLSVDGVISVDYAEIGVVGQDVETVRSDAITQADATSSGQDIEWSFVFPVVQVATTLTATQAGFTVFNVEADDSRVIEVDGGDRVVRIDGQGRIIYVGARNRRVVI